MSEITIIDLLDGNSGVTTYGPSFERGYFRMGGSQSGEFVAVGGFQLSGYGVAVARVPPSKRCLATFPMSSCVVFLQTE